MRTDFVDAFRLAYDGRDYHGYQRQPDDPTIEDELFDACSALGVRGGDAERPPGYSMGSRTDAGVSARAQTIAIAAPSWLEPAVLNGVLPPSIQVWASTPVDSAFHARHDAAERHYRYFLYAPAADIDRATAVINRLSGTHDFHNLTPASDHTERTIQGSVRRADAFLVIDLWAGGFVRELVRRIAGLVRRITTGDADLGFVDRVLAPDPLSGPEGIAPEPGTGVVLVDVSYPDIEFRVHEELVSHAREVFRKRVGGVATQARVLDSVATDLGITD